MPLSSWDVSINYLLLKALDRRVGMERLINKHWKHRLWIIISFSCSFKHGNDKHT